MLEEPKDEILNSGLKVSILYVFNSMLCLNQLISFVIKVSDDSGRFEAVSWSDLVKPSEPGSMMKIFEELR